MNSVEPPELDPEQIDFRKYYPVEYYKKTGQKIPNDEENLLSKELRQSLFDAQSGKSKKSTKTLANNPQKSRRAQMTGPDVERFNENLNEFKREQQLQSKIVKKSLGTLKEINLKNIDTKQTRSIRSASFRNSVEGARRLMNRLRNKNEQSSVKTLEILQLLNDVKGL